MKLVQFFLPICILFLPFWSKAQFQDNFDDGDLSNNPTWLGDSADFSVNADNELQLTAASAGSSLTYVDTQIPDSTLWELYFNADLAPSGSNGLRIYLQSDNNSFDGNGYYFEFGESGSDDAINFYRMDGGSGSLLGAGQIAAVGSAPADGRIRITRTIIGEWEVKVDYSGGNNLVTDLTFTDNTYAGNTGNFFGIQCEYTSSNTDNFFFDDINLAPLLPDVTPPSLFNLEVISGFELDVYFDEPLDETTSETIGNYIVSNGIGNPATAILDATNPSLVHLTFSTTFISGQENILSVNGVQDIVGNAMTNQELPFTFFFVEIPQQYEIVINEFMADPNPTVGLPNVEYVELYNNTDKTFELSGTTIASGGTPQVFDSYIFEPGEFLLLCDDENIDSLMPYGNVYAFSSFPALSNGGDEFVLRNEDGFMIDAVSYNSGWYQDSNKEDGGWSIEKINPDSPCEFESNWRASEDISGGTPGRENSILNQGQGSTEAELESLFLNNNNQLIVNYNVAVNEMLSTDINNYTISPSLGILSVSTFGDLGNQVLISFSDPIEVGVTYSVSTTNLTDCIGNPLNSNSLNFGKPEIAEAGDILINEILFNPESGGADFVEFYNNSNKIIDMSSLSIGNFMLGDSTANAITTSYLLLPQSYVVLTENPAVILESYTVEHPEALRSSNLPSFDDNEGNVTLYRSDPNGSTIIDQFDYEDDMHSAFLDDDNGVSLERINFADPTQTESNWHSAAVSAGFATPTYLNSQFTDFNNTDGLLTFQKKAFSPDADGFEDLLFVQYNTGSAGFTADVKIYDSEGRLVKHLLRNEIIPAQGTLRWDGLTDDQTKAGIGIYVLLAEFISDTGNVQQAKETFVLATRL